MRIFQLCPMPLIENPFAPRVNDTSACHSKQLLLIQRKSSRPFSKPVRPSSEPSLLNRSSAALHQRTQIISYSRYFKWRGLAAPRRSSLKGRQLQSGGLALSHCSTTSAIDIPDIPRIDHRQVAFGQYASRARRGHGRSASTSGQKSLQRLPV